MYCQLHLSDFPQITQFYSVTRNTLWQINNKDHILLFINDGTCQITVNNETFILHAGDVFFIPKNYSYMRESINHTMCKMTYIHFSLPQAPEYLDLAALKLRIARLKEHLDNEILSDAPLIPNQNNIFLKNHFTVGTSSFNFDQLRHIRLYSVSRQIMCGIQSSIALCDILCDLSQRTIEAVSSDTLVSSNDSIPAPLKKAIRYIRTNYAQKITLDALASHCNISKQQMIRYFNTFFHTTPNAYISEYRISHAKELLHTQPHLTIKEISDELGYNDQHYFTKVFTRLTGESPTQYRKRVYAYLATHKET